jgi:hypothetical protein
MSRRLMTASMACLALLAMLSCSGPGSAGDPTRPARSLSGRAEAIRRTMHCARRSPTSDGQFRTAPTPGVRPEPAVAVICEYASGESQPGRGSLAGQVTLGGRAADGWWPCSIAPRGCSLTRAAAAVMGPSAVISRYADVADPPGPAAATNLAEGQLDVPFPMAARSRAG